MQRKRLHARADHIGNEVEPRRRELVGPEVEVHRFAMVSPSWSHADLRGAHSMGNGRRWSRDVIPVGAGEPVADRSRTSKQAVNESSAPRTPATCCATARQGGPGRGSGDGLTPASHALAQGALPARSVPASVRPWPARGASWRWPACPRSPAPCARWPTTSPISSPQTSAATVRLS